MKSKSFCIFAVGVLACSLTAYGAVLHEPATQQSVAGPVPADIQGASTGSAEPVAPVSHAVAGLREWDCGDDNLVYENTIDEYGATVAGQEPGSWVADDTILGGEDRGITTYSVQVNVTGDVTITTALASDLNLPGPATVYENSECTFSGLPTGDQWLTCDLTGAPGGYVAVQNAIFVLVEGDTANYGWIRAEEAEFPPFEDPDNPGGTDKYFFFEGSTFAWWWGATGPWAGFAVTMCAEPGTDKGACCRGTCEGTGEPCDSICQEGTCSTSGTACKTDMECPGGEICTGIVACEFVCEDNKSAEECSGFGTRFGGTGTKCDMEDAFDPPCGAGACCADEDGFVSCYLGDLLEQECYDETFLPDFLAFSWYHGVDCSLGQDPCIAGACCYPDGSCVDDDASLLAKYDVDGDGRISEYECVVMIQGTFKLDEDCTSAECTQPCTLTCTGTDEGEPCDDTGEGRLNDGCNLDTPVFGSIANGETVVGTVWARGGSRDTDWYEVMATDDDGDGYGQMTFTITSQGSVRAMLVADEDGDCEDLDILANGTDPCAVAYATGGPEGETCQSQTFTACVAMSPTTKYYLWVGTASFDGEATSEITSGLPCGDAGLGYCLEFTFDDECALPCCLSGDPMCVLTTPDQCLGCGKEYRPNCALTCEEADCPVRPENNCCEDVGYTTILDPEDPGYPTTLTGSTSLATDEGNPFCGESTDDAAPNVYFKVLGNGRTITASMCNDNPDCDKTVPGDCETDYDGQLTIYCDSCEKLYCIGGSDDSCPDGPGFGMPATETWCSDLGEEYIIMVHGFYSETEEGWGDGNYRLIITDDGTPCDDPPACGPCDVECVGSDEGEPDCGGVNDGCQDGETGPPALVTPITCGETMCGTSELGGEVGGTLLPDYDWYELTLDAPKVVNWDVEAEFIVRMGIIQYILGSEGSGNCEDSANILSPVAISQACHEAHVQALLPAGKYWLYVASDFSDDDPGIEPFACGAEYQATVTCEEPGEIVCDGTPEGEPTCNDLNDACAADLPTVAFGETICGTSEFVNSDPATDPDYDWFEFETTETVCVRWEVEAEFYTRMGIIAYEEGFDGSGDCDQVSGISPFAHGPHFEATAVEKELTPGIWWMYVAPEFGGKSERFSCGRKYRATLGPCASPDLSITKVESCLTHDATEYCLELGDGGIEPRLAGIQKLVVTLDGDAPDSPVGYIYDSDGAEIAGVSAAAGPATDQVTLTVSPALPNLECCRVALESVLNEWHVISIKGDIDRGGIVNSVDASGVKPRFGATTDASNYLYDVDGNGIINSVDASSIKPRFGDAGEDCP